LVSRLAHFEPGYAYGIAAAFVPVAAMKLSRTQDGISAAWACGALLGISLLAWLVWLPVDHLRETGNGGAWAIFDDVLPEIFVVGIEGAVFALVPLQFLPGAKVREWSAATWATLQAIALFVFLLVVLDPHTNAVDTSERGGIVSAGVLFVGFAVGSLLFNRYFAWKGRPLPNRRPQSLPH
jgi:hypothetical protein